MADKEKSREAQVEQENRAFAEEAQSQKTDEQREEEALPNAMLDNLPEGKDYVGLLEYEVNPDPAEEIAKQQEENWPHVSSVKVFDPAELEPEEARVGRATTSRSDFGRVVVVLEEVLHDGEVYKPGIVDLPLGVADALISEGVAYEPAGKKRGR